MKNREEWPQGAVRGTAEINALIQRAKTTGVEIPAWHYDSNDGTYLYRFITADSFVDGDGLHYFDRDGEECRTGPSCTGGTDGWYLYVNYWFLFAHALRSGWQLKEYDLC